MERNFFTPEPIKPNKNPLFTEFALPNSIQKKPKTRKKDSLPENAGFIEQLKHALENPKQMKKLTFQSLCLAEIETQVAECAHLVSNADLPTKTKFHFYSCILDRAHNLYLNNETRIKIEPEKFPFTICLGTLYKHQKHAEITSLFTKHSFDAFMVLGRICEVFKKYYTGKNFYMDKNFYTTMELMDSQTVLYIANPDILDFLDREFQITPYDLKDLLKCKDHIQERLCELQQERLKDPDSKTICRDILKKTYPKPVEHSTGEDKENKEVKEHSSATTNSSRFEDYLRRYAPAVNDHYHYRVNYPGFTNNTFNVYNPVHVHYNFIMNPNPNDPVQPVLPQQGWTNYSAPVMYTQPQQATPHKENSKPSQQGLFSLQPETADEHDDEDNASRISIKNLLSK